MDGLDLNIDNYELEDILKLFDLKVNFGENDMRNAKKKVLMTHPDKSGLDKNYFLFFSKAYKILYSIYDFREKANKSDKLDIKNNKLEYLAEKDENNERIINNLREKNKLNNDEFNKWFNKLFDKVKLENEYDSGGYGEWLKSNKNNVINANNQSEMHREINNKKEELRNRMLSKYNKINESNNGSYCDLTNSQPEEYSSGMFSKLQFEDLKKAHEESVVPVTDEDYEKRYNSMDDIMFQRGNQNLNPLSERDAREYLNANNNKDNILSARRAYNLAKQDRKAEEANNKWWTSLKRLK
mgnify:CR=1 FL=1|tara:strand:+ start:729 stop:1622 length:894 start_codon:yes stop_codon:yes gene_type:complete